MIAWRDIGLLRQESTRLDFSVIAAVVATALAFNLLAAAGVGLALATVLFIREQVRGSVIRRKVSGARRLSRHHRLPLEQAILEREGTATTICELQGSLFFGTTDQLFTELEADLRGCRYLVLDWRRVRSVDFTAAHLLEQFEHRLAERGGFLIFSRLPQRLAHGLNLRAYFENVGVMSARAHVRCFESLDEAVAWVEERILAAARPERGPAETPLALEEFDLVRGAGEAAILAAMRASAVERTVAAGEAVFRAGVRSDELFLIRRGVVRITLPLADGTHHTLVSFGRGGFFGEIAFLDAGARSADAIAESPVELYVISRARFDAAAQAQPEAAVQLFAQLARALALRLRRADAEITSLYEA
jgi:SulP family sulfate permease